MMLFSIGISRKKGKARRKWRARAMIVDLSRTKVTFSNHSDESEGLPPWTLDGEEGEEGETGGECE